MALTIRVRLTVWLAAVLAVVVAALGAFLVIRLRADLLRGLDSTLTARAQRLALAMVDPGEGDFQDVGDAPQLSGLPRGDAVAQILGPDGSVLQASGEAETDAPLLDVAAVKHLGSRPYRRTIDLGREGEPYRILAIALPNRGGVLVVASSLDAVDNAVRRLTILLLVGGPVALALCGIGAYFLAARALGPIDRMTRAAATIGVDDTSVRLDVPAIEDEVGRLGRTLNQMLARLDSGFEEQRRFTADASHELRTPLSILAGEMEVAMDSKQTPPEALPLLESYREEVGRMTRIVEDLLMLARFDEGGRELSRTTVDLSVLARSVTERFAAPAAAKGVSLAVDADRVVVWGDDTQLAHLLTNLIDNALKYTPGSGWVRVSVGRDQTAAVIRVADSGIGIPAESLVHVFDRICRVDNGRSRAERGTGLGLAICKSIVQAHSGTIWVDSELDQGTTVTVRMASDEAV